MFTMKTWFVVILVVFNLTQSELIYLLYDMTSVPTLDNVCGLSPTQITAAQQSFEGGGVGDAYGTDTSQSPTLARRRRQKPVPTDVYAGDQYVKRQRELVDCLTYEEIAARSLDGQLALDVRSLVGQLATAKDAVEQSTVALFDAAGRLDAVLSEYRKAMAAADATTRALAEQRDAVRDNRRRVDRLHSQLSDAKTEVAASISKMNCSHANDFGVYATGCQPDDDDQRRRRNYVATPLTRLQDV